jgi:hypothetical protein
MTPRRVINMLWIGSDLGRTERLCIVSFLANGHPVHLHAYHDLAGIPEGTTLCDANAVVPFDMVRAWRNPKTGSYAVAADYFRYQLQKQGRGMWVDTDAVCLAPFEFESRFVAGLQRDGTIANGILYVDKGEPLIDELIAAFRPGAVPPWMTPRRRMKFMAWRMIGRKMPPSRYPWGTFGPAALTYLAKKCDLFDLALPSDVFYPYDYTRARWIFEPGGRISDILTERTVSVHLWNEKIREFKNMEPPSDSPLAELYRKFGV